VQYSSAVCSAVHRPRLNEDLSVTLPPLSEGRIGRHGTGMQCIASMPSPLLQLRLNAMLHVLCRMLHLTCCTMDVCCMLHVARWMHAACCMLHDGCMLHVACCTMDACCMLHVARWMYAACCILHDGCMLHVACCMLYATCCPLTASYRVARSDENRYAAQAELDELGVHARLVLDAAVSTLCGPVPHSAVPL
jgi:hypothetical protein